MLGQALTVNLANITAVRHVAAVTAGHRWRVKPSPCYLTLGRVDDDHRGFDVGVKARWSLFQLHSSNEAFVRRLVCSCCSVSFYELSSVEARSLRASVDDKTLSVSSDLSLFIILPQITFKTQ